MYTFSERYFLKYSQNGLFLAVNQNWPTEHAQKRSQKWQISGVKKGQNTPISPTHQILQKYFFYKSSRAFLDFISSFPKSMMWRS